MPASMATVAKPSSAGSGCRLPCLPRGSGTSANNSNKLLEDDIRRFLASEQKNANYTIRCAKINNQIALERGAAWGLFF